MKVKELGEAIMSYDLSKLEEPVKIVLYTYVGVLILIGFVVIITMIWIFNNRR